MGALPITRSDLVRCDLLLDEGEPAIAVASVSYGAFYAGAPDHIAHFATYDRGVTWTPVADAEVTYYQKLITRQKIKFALRDIAPRDRPDDVRLATSVDNMLSWQRIDKPLLAHGLVVSDFWLDDVTGALVAMVRPANSGNFPLQFWRSTRPGREPGALIADQQADLGVASGGFARPTGSWSLCAITPVDISAPLTVRCTADGGQTWSRFHRATPMVSPGDLPDELRALVWQVVFKRDDGKFIIAVMDSERAMILLLLDPDQRDVDGAGPDRDGAAALRAQRQLAARASSGRCPLAASLAPGRRTSRRRRSRFSLRERCDHEWLPRKLKDGSGPPEPRIFPWRAMTLEESVYAV